MNYTNQELLATDSLMGLFFAVTVMGLVYYYRRTGEVSLRNCAYAIVAAFVAQLAATAVPVTGYDWLQALSFGFVLVVAVFLYAVVSNLSQRKVSLTRISLMTGTTLVIAAILLLFGDNSRTGWLLLEAPAALLIAIATVTMLKDQVSPGRICIASLVAIHVGLRFLMAALPDPTLVMTLLFFDGIAVMLTGSALAIIHLESLVESLSVKDEKLQRYEQENRRLELQFSQAQKHESLGVLAGGIAHDFNNMLTSVLGYTNLAMKKLPADSEVRKDLYMVLSGARQAADLTSQMLVYAGKGAIEFESVDISRVVENMSGLINSIVPRKIHLTHKVANGLPLVKGDAVQIGQVAMNLIANAVDAIEDREGVVEVQTGLSQVTSEQLRKGWFSDKQESGAYVYLRVVDTGVGMDPAQIEKIFDPFYSESSQASKKGLGLSSIAGIIRQHKGFVQIESEKGAGSTFTAYFPIISYQDVERVTLQPATGLPARIKGRVLLADDDSRIRSLIASILESDGFAVVSVDDGREANRQVNISGGSFDLFVLDCTMPKLSGTDVYRTIRASGIRVPVILISGYHQEQVISDISNDDDAYFIKKPFSVDELIETANLSLQQRAAN